MNAIKYETAVRRGGKVEVTLTDTPEGTPVEVIVLFRDDTLETATALLAASEGTLGFWDNAVDDEAWNRV